MSEIDRQIGANIARLRDAAELSQQALADAMRMRGLKWAQATVWSVEKGTRPVRLSETAHLAEVLGADLEEVTDASRAAEQERDDRAERPDEVIGDNIKRLRKSVGFSQSALADALNLYGFTFSQQTVQKVEKGTRPLKFAEAVAVADVVGASLDDLSGVSGERLSAIVLAREVSAARAAFDRAKAELERLEAPDA